MLLLPFAAHISYRAFVAVTESYSASAAVIRRRARLVRLPERVGCYRLARPPQAN